MDEGRKVWKALKGSTMRTKGASKVSKGEVARVLKGKRLLLLQEVAESLDWPDSAVFTELKAGFDLVGDFPRTGVF